MLDLRNKRLKKELNLLDVYAIATGTTLSSGFFLLPGIAFAQAGADVVFAYLLAVIPLIPAMLSITELATAMPRAGGVYYFLDRTMGPMIGTIGGMGTWLALILKVSFALIGMGAYIHLFFPQLEIVPIAVAVAVILGIINFTGARKSGSLQIVLVSFLLIVLAGFILGGFTSINTYNFNSFFTSGTSTIISTAGLVYISYIGITKVASLSEEVKNPERNLPLGIFLSFGTSLLIYTVGTFIMVGVLPAEKLAGDLTPVADAAESIFGYTGLVVISVAALASFISVANAGTLSASRYPLAMGRDHIFSRVFTRLGKTGTPAIALLTTVFLIVLIIVLFDPIKIAKLASAFQLLIFALICLAVIVIRESRIDSYDPGFKSPFYPYLHIFGVVVPLIFISQMGLIAILFSSGLVLIGAAWYWFYARKKVLRTGAIYHIFERLGRLRYVGLDSELRGIMKEKGLRESDPFDEIVARSYVIDLNKKKSFKNVVDLATSWISQFVKHTSDEIRKEFMEGTRMGATPVTHGIALPHLRIPGLQQAEMVLVRAREGVHIEFKNPLTDNFEEAEIKAIFFLVSPEKDPGQHLRILAQIAGRVEEETFEEEWDAAADEQELKEALLHEERCIAVNIEKNNTSEKLIGKELKDVHFPQGALVALLRRRGEIIIPDGKTVFEEGDRITIIGNPDAMNDLRKEYEGSC